MPLIGVQYSNVLKKMKSKIFSLLVCSVLSLSIISDMDFDNLSALDWAVIISTGAMWLVNGAYFARRLLK